MKYVNIAMIGRARSGKDTVAARLVSRYQYTRVAFADPLKEAALRIDPIVDVWAEREYQGGDGIYRLSDIVRVCGWERAKDEFPEVRRILQHVGQTVREYDPDFWLNIALRKLDGAARWNLPVVVTDCRYPNEADALKRRGFRLVRIVRPGTDTTGAHESETALAAYEVDETIHNVSSLGALHSWADGLPFMR